jgi:hypothetical protein
MDTKIRVLKNPVSYLRIPEVPYPYRLRTVSSVTEFTEDL